MLSVTFDQWSKATYIRARARSPALVLLDNAIKAGNPFTAKNALDNWIGEQSNKNQEWRSSGRNASGAVQRLYDELGMSVLARPFLDQLALDAVACRAGSRVLQVPEDNGLTPSALLWIACGFQAIVTADTANTQQLNLSLGNSAVQIRGRTYPKFLLHAMKSPAPGLTLGGDSFLEWTGKAIGSCAEMGSGDAVIWLETLCNRVDVPWSLYSQRVVDAFALGRQEFATFEAERLRRERFAGAIVLPEQQLLQDGRCNDYLKQIVTLNNGKPEVLLVEEWKKQRRRIHAELMIDEEENLITWDQARKLRR